MQDPRASNEAGTTEPLPAPPALPPLNVKLGDAGAKHQDLLLMPRYPEPAAPDAGDSGRKKLRCARR